MTLSQIIGMNIRHYRRNKAMTQAELAEALFEHGLDWNQSHVSRAESGGFTMIARIDVLCIIAQALNVRIPVLLEYGPDMDLKLEVGHHGVMARPELLRILAGKR